MFGRKGQLLVVRCLSETRVQSRYHYYATRTKSRNKIAVHRVFVDVDLDLAQKWDQRLCCSSRAFVSRASDSRSASISAWLAW
jgi:hypothetical protein